MHRSARLLVVLAAGLISSLAMVASAADVPSPPKVDAPAYILIDQASGRTLASERADERAEPASITKLMTAYVTFRALKEGRLKLDELVPISERAWRAEGSRTFLNVGDRVPVEVLLQGMIVQSGNDAATALAERLGGSEEVFGQLMTREAKRLGMKNSNFTNATGLPDPALYTTPRDIAILSRALIGEFPQYYRWYSQREFVWNNIKQGNRNGLLYSDPSADGIKTGYTESAGYCLASSAERNGTRMIAVVFGTKSPRIRERASAALLNYGFAFYETVSLRKAGDAVFKPRVYKGAEQYASVGPASNVQVTVARGTRSRLKTSTTLNEPLLAPLKAGQTVGEMRVLDGKTVIKRVPLVVNDEVAEGGLWAGTRDTVALWFR